MERPLNKDSTDQFLVGTIQRLVYQPLPERLVKDGKASL